MKRFKQHDDNKSGVLERDDLESAIDAFLTDEPWHRQHAQGPAPPREKSPAKPRPKSRPKSRPRPNLRNTLSPGMGEKPARAGRVTPHADDFGLLEEGRNIKVRPLESHPGHASGRTRRGGRGEGAYVGRGASALNQIMNQQ